MVKGQNQFGHVEFHVLFGEHDLFGQTTKQVTTAQKVENQVEFALGLESF
jgi:hypothetical protein